MPNVTGTSRLGMHPGLTARALQLIISNALMLPARETSTVGVVGRGILRRPKMPTEQQAKSFPYSRTTGQDPSSQAFRNAKTGSLLTGEKKLGNAEKCAIM